MRFHSHTANAVFIRGHMCDHPAAAAAAAHHSTERAAERKGVAREIQSIVEKGFGVVRRGKEGGGGSWR